MKKLIESLPCTIKLYNSYGIKELETFSDVLIRFEYTLQLKISGRFERNDIECKIQHASINILSLLCSDGEKINLTKEETAELENEMEKIVMI